MAKPVNHNPGNMRITGITRRQKELFHSFYANAKSSRRKDTALAYNHYTSRLREELLVIGASPASLNLRSRCALFNIEGLTALALGKAHRYGAIYNEIRGSIAEYPDINRRELVLEMVPAERFQHRFQLDKSFAHFHVSFATVDFPDHYFSDISHYLCARVSKKDIHPGIIESIFKTERNYPLHLRSISGEQRPPSKHPGHQFDLEEIFDNLNREYFNNGLPQPGLRWSRQISRNRLGFYDSSRHLLTINRVLDSPEVPVWVVEGIVHHEMLHILHPVRIQNGRRIIHSREFKQDEKTYRCYEKVSRWLKEEFPAFLNRSAPPRRKKKRFRWK